MELNTPPKGVKIYSYPNEVDDRGFFKRIVELRDRESNDWDFSIASNPTKHTLRGLHFNKNLGRENKYVNVISGSLLDVLVDMRPHEPTYLNWFSLTLTSSSNLTVYIPSGIAHGYITLEDNTIISYVMDSPFNAQEYGRIRWNDPTIGILWPFSPAIISKLDQEAEFLSLA